MKNIFQMRDDLIYNLRSQIEFFRSSSNTSQYGLNLLRVFSSKVWNMVPTNVRNSQQLLTALNIFNETNEKVGT